MLRVTDQVRNSNKSGGMPLWREAYDNEIRHTHALLCSPSIVPFLTMSILGIPRTKKSVCNELTSEFPT